MKHDNMKHRLIAASILVASLASAQSPDESQPRGLTMAPKEPPSRNRLGVGIMMGFNMKTDFEGLGRFAPATDPGPATGSQEDRFYDDGYNRLDSSGNAGATTWYWGYENASQWVGDTIVMHSTSSVGAAERNEEEDTFQSGLELTYARDLGALGRGRWGVESAFGFMDMVIRDRSPLAAPTSVLSDAYQLGGVVPPVAPYSGTFLGPGALLGSTPTRSGATVPGGSIVQGSRELDASYYGFRVGPYWEVPLSEKFAAMLSGGFAFAMVDGEFDYRETVTVPGLVIPDASGSNEEMDVVLGGYVAASIHYYLNESLRAYSQVQYQSLGDYTNNDKGHKATIDFGSSILFSLGLNYSF